MTYLEDSYIARVYVKNPMDRSTLTMGLYVPRNAYDKLDHKIKEKIKQVNSSILSMSYTTYSELEELLKKNEG